MFSSKYGVARHIYIAIPKAGSANHAVGADWTPAAGDVKISKDGGAAANVTNLPTAIAMGNSAVWDFSLTATEMQAAQIMVTVADSATKAVDDTGFIIETFGNASANWVVDLSNANIAANVTQLLGTAWLTPGTAGTPDVNVKLWNALTTVALPLTPTVAGRTLDCSAGGEAGVDWANVGSPTTSLALTGTTIATTQKVDIETIKTNPVVNAGTVTFPTTATLASTTNITAGTIATVSGSVGSVVGAVGSVTGNVSGSVALLGSSSITQSSFAAGAINAAAINTAAITAAKFAAGAIDAAALATDAGTEIAGAVWDLATSGHTTSGTFGAAAVAAGGAGDPWSTSIPGSYGAGTAGYIVGTNLNATISSRMATFTVPTNFASLVISAGGVVSADSVAISGDTVAADNLESAADGTGYNLGGGSVVAASVTAAVATTSNVKKNQALASFEFMMTDSTNHAPATGKTVTVTRSIDGGAFAAGTLSSVTEVSNGIYKVSFAAADLNGNVVTLRATATSCDDTFERIVTQP